MILFVNYIILYACGRTLKNAYWQICEFIAGILGSNTRQAGEILINGRKQRLAFGTSVSRLWKKRQNSEDMIWSSIAINARNIQFAKVGSLFVFLSNPERRFSQMGVCKHTFPLLFLFANLSSDLMTFWKGYKLTKNLISRRNLALETSTNIGGFWPVKCFKGI